MPSAPWLVLVPLLASAIIWWPLTGAYFHADDFLHLYVIADGRPLEFLLTPYAGHMLTVWNGLVLLAHALFGADPRGYYGLAVILHLLNVAALFALLRRAAGGALACFGATLWGTAPYVGASLGWLSVTGHVVLTAFVLLALDGMLRVARAGRRASGREALAWAALLLAGAACFGIGIGVAAAAAIALPLLLPHQRTVRMAALGLPVAVVAAYVVTHVAYAAYTHHAHAAATPELSLAALPTVVDLFLQLLATGIAAATAGILAAAWPAGTAGLVALWTVVVGAALWRGQPADRRAVGAVLLLAAGSYGIVALGRGPRLASLGLSAGSAAESARYHYLPGALLVVALCIGLSAVSAPWRLPRATRQAALALWLLLAALTAWRRPVAIDYYDAERDEVTAMRDLLRQRAADTPGDGAIYLFNRRLYPLGYLVRPQEFPGWAGAYIATEPANAFGGRAVRFIENDGEVVRAARQRPGTRTTELLVARDEYRRAVGLPPSAAALTPDGDAPGPSSPPAPGP